MAFLSWARVIRADLAETADVRLEIIDSEDEARKLIRDHRRAAVILFKPHFSRQMSRCSFLSDGLNPFHRDGVLLDGKPQPPGQPREALGVEVLQDPTQPGASAIIEQVAQVSLLRVILPYMIGQAFGRLSDPEFIQILGREVNLPVPERFKAPLALSEGKNPFLKRNRRERMTLQEILDMAAGKDEKAAAEYRSKVGGGVKTSLQQQFAKYNLSGKTWEDLTRAHEEERKAGAEVSDYADQGGSGVLRRGAQRYQFLVPSYVVMFAFFLVLNVGWIFVAERRQGTLKRLRAAPLGRGQVIVGKLLPCYLVSVLQGVFLLVAGRLLFGMRWGPEHWPWWQQSSWLLLVVCSTSFAAMGMAMLVAALARTEMQVALFGAVPVLVLALIGGCVLPPALMPETTQQLSYATPQGWALSAYRELLVAPQTATLRAYEPNLDRVVTACAVLAGCGAAFLAGAWALLRLE
jgi:ABC-type multidrug transport system permease subunit